MTRNQLADFFQWPEWASAKPGLFAEDWLGEKWEVFFEEDDDESYSPIEEQAKFRNSTAGWVEFYPVKRPEPDSHKSSPRGKSFKLKLRDLSKRKLVAILKK